LLNTPQITAARLSRKVCETLGWASEQRRLEETDFVVSRSAHAGRWLITFAHAAENR